jgi:hydroxyacylglutathione hydrolase
MPIAKQAAEIKLLQPKAFQAEMGQGVVIDARDPEAFAGGHIPKAYSVWAEGLPIFGGWVAGSGTNVYLVLSKIEQLEDAVLSLGRIGVDKIEGVLAGGFDAWRDAGLPIARSGTTAVQDVKRRLGEIRVLDVREDGEFEDEGHVPGASHLYAGYLEDHIADIKPPLDKKRPVAVVCSVGHRAGMAASILERHGFEQVENVLGGMTAWTKQELPIAKGAENTVTTPEIEGARR